MGILEILIIVLLIAWLLGYLGPVKVGGDLIHIILVVVVIILVYKLLGGGGI